MQVNVVFRLDTAYIHWQLLFSLIKNPLILILQETGVWKENDVYKSRYITCIYVCIIVNHSHRWSLSVSLFGIFQVIFMLLHICWGISWRNNRIIENLINTLAYIKLVNFLFRQSNGHHTNLLWKGVWSVSTDIQRGYFYLTCSLQLGKCPYLAVSLQNVCEKLNTNWYTYKMK